MSMLAGPRRKQKVINLRAKNNAWSNDNSKFGQRMLEKMGWSTGKGLGAHEDGIVEHVVAKYKNDDCGLGYEDKNDQWTKHEDDFNSLLANLSNAESIKEDVHSGVSLELKSKKSKARIHYHKFSRAKDLSRYSEKDLASIFGKKTLKKDIKEVEVVEKEDFKTTENVFTEKGSMEDYFKSKLASFKSKNKQVAVQSHKNNYVDNDADYIFRGFTGTSEGTTEQNDASMRISFQPFSFYNSTANDTNDESELTSLKISNEKQKNKKKKPKNEDNTEDNCDNTLVVKKEKKSKKYLSCNDSAQVLDIVQEINKSVTEEAPNVQFCGEESQPTKSKKSKKKRKNSENLEENAAVAVDLNVPKKKKKRRNEDIECNVLFK